MEFSSIFHKDKICIYNTRPDDKIEMLRQLLHFCLENRDISRYEDDIWPILLERERSVSTGIGMGVAIPHCSTPFVKEIQASLALLTNGIDFQAVDNEPVQIIVLLLMPENKFDRHIKILAAIAKLFNKEEFRKIILNAPSATEAHNIFLHASKGVIV